MRNKIVMLILGFVVFSTAAFAQQGQKASPAKSNATAVNPNIERMRVVNEKMAAEKATKANQTNEQRIAEMNKRNSEIRVREQQVAGAHKTSTTVSKH